MVEIRPVFDPALPVEVRYALLTQAEGRRPGSAGPLPPDGGQPARGVVRALSLGAVCGVLPVVLVFTRMFGLAGRMIAAAGQAGLALAWLGGYLLGGGLWPGIIATLAVQLTCSAGAFGLMPARQLRSGIRRAHGHYLVSADFDPENRALLARAQAAIAAVTGAQTVAAGLLDEVANDVTLSRQEWEIAQALARRGDAPDRYRQDDGKPALVIRRVEALERYAQEVRDTDEAWSQQLGASVAGPAAELVALAEIEDLTEGARRVRDAIRADRPHPGQHDPGQHDPGQHGSGPPGPRREDR